MGTTGSKQQIREQKQDSSQKPHLQALVRKQTKLPSVAFNLVLMPGDGSVAALPALPRFSLHEL